MSIVRCKILKCNRQKHEIFTTFFKSIDIARFRKKSFFVRFTTIYKNRHFLKFLKNYFYFFTKNRISKPQNFFIFQQIKKNKIKKIEKSKKIILKHF